MEILATAKLEYYDGESVIGGWERLVLVVKFKEGKKFFKTTLHKTLASTYNVVNSHLVPDEKDRYDSFDEYYEEVEYLIKDDYVLKREAEKMIKDYFLKMSETETKNNRTAKMAKLVNNSPKIEIKVKID